MIRLAGVSQQSTEELMGLLDSIKGMFGRGRDAAGDVASGAA